MKTKLAQCGSPSGAWRRGTHLTALSTAVALATILSPSSATARAASAVACPTFVPGPHAPEKALPENAEAALDAPVTRVTDGATADEPIVIEYEQETASYVGDDSGDQKFFNLQVVSAARWAQLHIRAEWAVAAPSDIDIYLHNSKGRQVAYSDTYNSPALDGPSPANGGPNFEHIDGFVADRCAGYVLMTHAWHTPGTDVTLELWLEPAPPREAGSGCDRFQAWHPETTAAERTSKPVKVFDRATEQRPVTRVVELPPTVVFWVTDAEIVERGRYVNIQIAPGTTRRFLSIRAEWPAPSESEIDLYLRDEGGTQVAASKAMNPAPTDAVDNASGDESGGDGWEGGIVDVPVWPCDEFTLELEPIHTLGEEVTLTLWVTT